MNCIFCKIIEGEIPSYKIYEDDTVTAFLDIDPKSDGHTLLIPKKHYQDIFDIDNVVLTHIIDVSKKLGKDITSKLNADGVTFTQNNGDVQEVKHFHMHLIPYYNVNKKPIDVLKIFNKLK